MGPDRVVITGGEGDLGRALLTEFSLNKDRWLADAPGRHRLDVTDEQQVSQYFQALPDLAVLIVNAGISRDARMVNLAPNDFDATLEVNLRGAFLSTRAVLPQMQARRSGHIILIGSRTAVSGAAGQTAYSASKAALHGLAMSIAREYGPENIRCNVVLPGFLETKMSAGITDKRRKQIRSELTLERFNTPENAARFVAFLAGLDHVSGQVFTLDSRLDRWA